MKFEYFRIISLESHLGLTIASLRLSALLCYGVWVYTIFFLRFFRNLLIEKLFQTLETVFHHIFQTPRSLTKILRCALCFQFSSRCLVLWWNADSRVTFITDLGFWGFLKFNLLLKTHLMLIRRTWECCVFHACLCAVSQELKCCLFFLHSYSSGGEDGYVRVHVFDPSYFEVEFEY